MNTITTKTDTGQEVVAVATQDTEAEIQAAVATAEAADNKRTALARQREELLEKLQPDPQKRQLVCESYNIFVNDNQDDMKLVSENNKKQIFMTLMQLGLPLSKDTIYLHIQKFGTNYTLTIQDNYLFLQKMVMDYVDAQGMTVNVVYNKELEYLKANNIGTFDIKEDVIPIYELESNCIANNVAFIQMSLVFKNGEHRYRTVFSKDKLIERAGNAVHRGMWKSNSNHVKIELLKKTAIRAFVKEKFGGALEIIRSIDIAEQQILEKFAQ